MNASFYQTGKRRRIGWGQRFGVSESHLFLMGKKDLFAGGDGLRDFKSNSTSRCQTSILYRLWLLSIWVRVKGEIEIPVIFKDSLSEIMLAKTEKAFSS